MHPPSRTVIRLAALAVRIAPARRHVWAQAMVSELAHIPSRGGAARFAIGCVLAAAAMRAHEAVVKGGPSALVVAMMAVAALLARAVGMSLESATPVVTISLGGLALLHLLGVGVCLKLGPRALGILAAALSCASGVWLLAGAEQNQSPFLTALACETALIWALLGLAASAVAHLTVETAP